MHENTPAEITLTQFAAGFVPAGLMLTASLLVPELERDLNLGRTRYTIWVTTILLAPTLAAYPFRTLSRTVANFTHLAWTWAWCAFMTHAYWAVFVYFDGPADTVRQMGVPISSVNGLLTALWTADVVLLWCVRRPGDMLVRTRAAVRIFTFLVFAVTLLFLREGLVFWLGVAFTAVVLGAIFVRWLVHTGEPAAAAV